MRITVLLLACVVVVWAAGPVRSEARIVFESPRGVGVALGPLAGELDVCSFGRTEDGRPYLVVFADAGQLAALRAQGLSVEVTWPDIRDKFRAMTGCDPDDGSFRDFGYFFNYWEMRDTIKRLAALHPDIVRLDSSMLSFQNRPLWCVKISDNPGVEEGEPQVFFNGATHAREPMGTHTCITFASLLCAGYGTDSAITWLVNNREVYVVPVMNPDGYVWNSDSGGSGAYWRKNRHGPVPPSVGIDLNRNYGFKWGYDNSGSSPDPASEVYRGTARFSEPEVEAIHQFERQHRFRTAIDFHSYGRDNLYPWCYIGTAPPEESLLVEITDTFALYNGYGNNGQWYYTLYPSNGTSIDWEFADTLDEGLPKFITYALTSELGINDFWYGSSNPPYVDSEVARNVPNCYYFTRLCGVWLDPVSMTVNDSTGNNNGQLDPGEQANLWFEIENRALHALDTAQNVTAVLVPADTVIQVLTPTVNFPSMPRRTSANNQSSQFQVRCSPNAQPGDTIDLRLEVTFEDAGVTIMQPVQFRLVVGANPVGVAGPKPRAAGYKLRPTVARGVLVLPQAPSSKPQAASWLMDISGRKVMDLRPGANDVSSLAPGVYFVRTGSQASGWTSRIVLPGR